MANERSRIGAALLLLGLCGGYACGGSDGPSKGTGGHGGSSTGGGSAAMAGGQGGAVAGGAAGGGLGGWGGRGALPAATVSDMWKPGPQVDTFFRGPALAATSVDGAIAYLTGPSLNEMPWHLTIQGLDGEGVRRGSPVVLDTDRGAGGYPTMASDGQRYVVCWEKSRQVSCVSWKWGEGDATSVFQGSGFFPSLVYGPAGWLLAWRTADTMESDIVLQRMNATFEKQGTARTLPAAPGQRPAIAATQSGYVVLTGNPSAAQWLDQDLKTGAVLPLGLELLVANIGFADPFLAATDTTLALTVPYPYKALLYVADADRKITKAEIMGGVKLGLRIGVFADLRPNHAALGAFWPTFDDSKKWVYQQPLIAAPASTTTGFAIPVNEGSDVAMARIGEKMFAAVNERESGSALTIYSLGL